MNIPIISNSYQVKMSPYETAMENGVNYYLISDSETDLVKIELVCTSGIKYQQKSFQYRIMTDLLLEGTNKYPGNSLKEKIEELGGNIDVDCSRDHVIIEIIFLQKFKIEIFDILKEILFYPSFTVDAFNRMMSNLKTDYVISKTKSNVIAGKILMQQLFENHYYGVFANEDDFNKLTIEDVKSVHKDFLNSIKYVFVGGAANPEIFSELSQIIPKYAQPVFKREVVFSNTPNIITSEESKFEQDTIRIGTVVNQDKNLDIFSFKMANLIFGGFFGSRLNKSIREEKGWTYGIFSTIVEMEDASYLIISSDLKKDVSKEAIELLDKELRVLQNSLVKDAEFELASRYIKGSLLQKIDGVFGQLGELQQSVLKGRNHYDYYNNYSDSIDLVTPEKLQEAYQIYFNHENWVKVIVN